jgi:hypothetical protein
MLMWGMDETQASCRRRRAIKEQIDRTEERVEGGRKRPGKVCMPVPQHSKRDSGDMIKPMSQEG